MCTVTVLYRQAGLLVTMNRDERIDRPAEIAPYIRSGTDMTAPQDGLASGTWIGMNKNGWWACLLNSYENVTPPPLSESRGLLIPDILKRSDPIERIGGINMRPFAPFRLLVGTRDILSSYHWDGQNLNQVSMPSMTDAMISSSSWQAERVLPLRQTAFKEWQEAGAAFDAKQRPTIHFWTGDDPRSGILMTRERSHTTSMTQIIMDQRQSTMHYWPRQQLIAFDV